jgi:hypothetical protein
MVTSLLEICAMTRKAKKKEKKKKVKFKFSKKNFLFAFCNSQIFLLEANVTFLAQSNQNDCLKLKKREKKIKFRSKDHKEETLAREKVLIVVALVAFLALCCLERNSQKCAKTFCQIANLLK